MKPQPLFVVSRFVDELARRIGSDGNAHELLPVFVAQALAAALPADGVSLGVMEANLRIPLAASSETAAEVERLQSTLGDGPCITAYSSSTATAADLEQIQQRWPVFAAAMIERSPFRSIASIPLSSRLARLGALDVYWSTPEIPAELRSVVLAPELEAMLAAVLLADDDETRPPTLEVPAWLDAPAAARRFDVWIAVGIVMQHRRTSNIDALDLLRAAAFAGQSSIDDLAAEVITGRVAMSGPFDGPDADPPAD